MTFDNENELRKIKQYFPEAELVLRIKVDDSKSLCKVCYFILTYKKLIRNILHKKGPATTLKMIIIINRYCME